MTVLQCPAFLGRGKNCLYLGNLLLGAVPSLLERLENPSGWGAGRDPSVAAKCGKGA
jgi:hypothetical protein